MSLRNKVLAGVLALQAVIIVVVFWPRSGGPGIEQLIEGLTEPDVVAVTITDGEGKSLRINRSPFGCVLPGADDYPCAKNRLPDFLHRIVPLTTASLVTDSEASHARLNVAENSFERTVELELADGRRHKFFLGTSPRGRSGHARLDGQDEVYLAPGLSAFDAPVREDAWVDPLYFSVSQDQAASVTVENPTGAITLEIEDSGDWKLAGDPPQRPLDQAKARNLVRAASSIRLSRPLGNRDSDSYGLDAPAATVTVRQGDAENREERVVLIGARLADDDGFVAKSSESDYYVVVDETVALTFIGQDLDSLLETPVVPTPDASN